MNETIQPVYTPAPSNGAGTTGLAAGVVGFLFAWVPLFGFLLGVLAVVLGWVGLSQVAKGEATNPAVAGTGIALGMVATLFWPALFLITAAVH